MRQLIRVMSAVIASASVLLVACGWLTDWAMRTRLPVIDVVASRRCSHIYDCMTTLSSDARLPLYQRLRDHLAGRIAAQDWKAGDPIPSEAELSATHAVSVGTVRKAIDCLVAEGLLDRQQGRGTYVRRARFNSSLFRFFRFQSERGERRIPQSRILRRKVVAAPSA